MPIDSNNWLNDWRSTMTRDNLSGKIGIFLAGLGIGVGAALLLAPKSGARLRGDIADGANDLLDEARRTGKQVQKRAQKLVELAKDRVTDAIDAGEDAYREAKKV
jgi:gas vesicle protein